jgi:hypothetical protein
MGWIWLQWLQRADSSLILDRVDPFLTKGMKLQEASSLFYMRPHADLYLLHCAIFASPWNRLKELAGRVVDATGFSGYQPENNGELYPAAWCGMLKHWILGNEAMARANFDLIWGAYRHPSSAAANKPLVAPWIEGKWTSFVKAQQKDFDRLWARGRKDGTVRSESGDTLTVTVHGFPIEQKWSWAHCGLALLAYRRGIEVVTDPFWFPPHALKCVPRDGL